MKKDIYPNPDVKSVLIQLASPKEILAWSHGEVTKPETINYRVGRPEKGGLFCEKIFGPTKDYQCYCGKYKGIRYKGIVCDRCGVEVTKSSVRRERMGHITLAAPVAHIWFLKKMPSHLAMAVGAPSQKVERVVYSMAYIITKIDEEAREKISREIKKEYEEKIKGKSKEEKAELRESYYQANKELNSLRQAKVISEKDYRSLSLKFGPAFEAETGAEAIKKLLEEMDLKKEIAQLNKKLSPEMADSQKEKLTARIRFLREMQESETRPEWMIMTVLPVLPPGLRPMVQLDGGRYASSDVNDLYRRVINRNNRLKRLLEIDAPTIIIRNEKRMLQEAVDSLIGDQTGASSGRQSSRPLRSLTDKIQGKRGRFRRNLLGKRVDYSARSVIAVGPELKISECGLPKKMALELFKPFVVKKILDQELAYNIRGASRLIEKGIPEVWAILEEVVKGKAILLNRAPTLHRLGIQAFYPTLIEGNVIRIHPLICSAFNADFDGDQMAVHLPLFQRAQKEASELMLSGKNLLKPATGLPIVTPSQDMILGIYYLTTIENSPSDEETKVFHSEEEAQLAMEAGLVDLRTAIKIWMQPNISVEPTFIRTTVGRLLFNQALPVKYSFFNKQVDSSFLRKIIGDIINSFSEESQDCLDKVKSLGFEYATLSGLSFGMDDFIVPEEKEGLIKKAEQKVDKLEKQIQEGLLSKEEGRQEIIKVWGGVSDNLRELLQKTLPENGPVASMVSSGSRGSWSQPLQMCGMKGLVVNPSGRIIELPIKSSFKEGLDVLEYFLSTHGARKGQADKALRTSAAGYLTRRLVDVAHNVIIREEDCGDTEGIEISREEVETQGRSFVLEIVGRVVLEDVIGPKNKNKIVVKDGIISWEQAREIDSLGVKKVKVRSPLTCKTVGGICQKCYGWDLGRNKLVELGEAVGIVAAQAIGEPGTQLTMRTFHLGGVAGEGDITQGLPRVEELFEDRIPKKKAVMAFHSGKVTKINTQKRIVTIQGQEGKKNYQIPEGRNLFVQIGEKVEAGQPLCSGSIRPSHLFKHFGFKEATKYLLNESQKVYATEGVKIHSKHLEVIIRQMFSQVRITDPGNSLWMKGKVVERHAVEEVSRQLTKEKKKAPSYKPLLEGISKVSLNSTSWLSAASFQRTPQILIDASLRREQDKLRGLKENVIIAQVVPAGTGYRRNLDQNGQESKKEKTSSKKEKEGNS
jgi:DNA-directed RNA polymerase subunit beta'